MTDTTRTAQQVAQSEQEEQKKMEEQKKEEKAKESNAVIRALDSTQDWLTRNLGIFGTFLGNAVCGSLKLVTNILTCNFSEVFSWDTAKSLLSLGGLVGGAWGISKLVKKSSGTAQMLGVSAAGLVATSLLSGSEKKETASAQQQPEQTTGSSSKALASSGAQNITKEAQQAPAENNNILGTALNLIAGR